MTGRCRICGRLFNAKQSNYVTCSQECRKVNNKQLQAECNRRNSYRYKPVYKKKTHYCRICGEPIVQTGKRQFHEKCVVADAVKAIREGVVPSNDPRVKRAAQLFNYSVKELRELSEEGDYDD